MKQFIIMLLASLCSKLSAAVIFTTVPNVYIEMADDFAFYHVDFNSDGVNDVSLRATGFTFGTQALPEGTNRVFGTAQHLPDFSSLALRFGAGQTIGPSILGDPEFALVGITNKSFGSFNMTFGPTLFRTVLYDSGVSYDGQFSLYNPGYLGVEFNIAGQIHYGYVFAEGSGINGAIVRGFAYETQPGVPIIAGAVPEPTAFALLVPGMFLLLSRRRCGPRNGKRCL